MKFTRKISAAVLCAAMIVFTSGCGMQTDNYGAYEQSYIPIEINEGDFTEAEQWDGSYSTEIKLNGETAEISGEGATAENAVLRIEAEGEYLLSGSFSGQIVIDADDCNVRLILNGADISCSSSSAIYAVNAKNVYITLADGSENSVSDASEYVYSGDEDEPNAAIFSHDDLIFDGTGSLTVYANYNNGIRSKDDLEFHSGTYNITAVDNGISGKDSVAIKEGTFVVNAGGDGIRSTNDGDSEKGWISIAGGSFDINAGQDGIQAYTTISISGGNFDIFTGVGSSVTSQSEEWGSWGGFPGDMPGGMPGGMGEEPPGGFGGYGGMGRSSSGSADLSADDLWGYYDSSSADGNDSAKAVKSGNDMRITGGSFTVDSSDDCIHCGGSLEISGGELALASGDDAVHSDNSLVISGGEINVSKSYEGIEALAIDVTAGTINIAASDDGINAAGGNDGSAFGSYGGMGGFGEGSPDYYVSISGGTVSINASGDGIDTNGNLFIKGGETYISGSENNGNSAVDYALSFEISGGTFAAFGSAGMAVNASGSSAQPVMMAVLSRTAAAGMNVSIAAEDGTVIYSGQPEKSFSCIIFSSPVMKVGEKVIITIGNETAELKIESTVTTYGSQGGMGGEMGGHGGPGGHGGRS